LVYVNVGDTKVKTSARKAHVRRYGVLNTKPMFANTRVTLKKGQMKDCNF
jgi:hypothetical protein